MIELPSTNDGTKLFKCSLIESLHKCISQLILSAYILEVQTTIWVGLCVVNVGPEVMVLDGDMFSTRSKFRCLSEFKATRIILKTCSVDLASWKDKVKPLCLDLFE